MIELLIATFIAVILALIAYPAYDEFIERTRRAQAAADIRDIEIAIDRYAILRNGQFPATLADVGQDGRQDPWGEPYEYLNLGDAANRGRARKDRRLVPINSDFDLYSKGKDKRSVPPLTAQDSRDDIVRANNGRFIGLAEDY